MSYKKWNTYLGWLIFLIATIVYFITIEDTVSLWDCGEYITAAYKLEVGHPPGAPLFMVIGRLFSFFADPEHVAVWINRLSGISSSLTVLFMFWSLTLLIKKITLATKSELSAADKVAIFGSAAIGSLAYAFSESLWFSAVEGEVYAMSSLFTAVIFWAILKWDEEMAQLQIGQLSADFAPNRWLLLIMFLLGLAIGVHLLGILVVPAISFVIYFRNKKVSDVKGILITGVLSIVILGFIQEGVIPGSISLASFFEVAFVNSLGLPFFSGTIFFFAVLIAGCIWLIRYARKKNNALVYNATMGLIFLLIGYGSFAVIVIRSNANPPLDENDPENLVTLHSYLKREQYGSAPILFGPQWNSKENPQENYKDRSPFYLRRFIVSKGDKVLKAFKDENRALAFAKENAASVEEKYFESNAQDRKNVVATYAQSVFFPRMYWNQEQQRIDGYKNWSGYDPNDGASAEIGKDGKRLPTFGENMTYFMRYQVNWMYMRYFMWNFAGRQNDIQGHGDNMRGNWLSGFDFIDNARLGNQGDAATYYTSENKSNNTFFFLPLILGLIGLVFHFYRAPKDAFVVSLAFLFTGVAILVYLNQKPFEPRERDYAYAGSFYFFAFWIGIGAYALYDAFVRFQKQELLKASVVAGAGLLLMLVLDVMGSEVSLPNTLSWLVIAGIALAALAGMVLLKKVTKSEMSGALAALALTVFVPIIMGVQGFDDHDRSLKTSAHDLALNYLESCEKNGILFTNGDNDTFPLWYMQEVEGKRTDVRVCNLSLMQTDWYTDQMKMRAYDSDPLPIKFTEDQILMYAGSTDQVLFGNLFELFYINASDEVLRKIIALRVKSNPTETGLALEKFNNQLQEMVAGMSTTQPAAAGRIEKLKSELTTNVGANLVDIVYSKYRAGFEILSGIQGGLVTLPEGQAQAFQTALMDLEKTWDVTQLKEAMEFVRDDKNLVAYTGQRMLRVFPSSGFILPVNKNNAVKSGVIRPDQREKCLDDVRFKFEARGITREQVMMLDILANNEWKRGIYFSSPGGSEVSMALYQKGYIKQNGMTYELSPLREINNRFTDNMYTNLMSKYKFGAMDNPKVLTDYYTRRHTSQYRLYFASLADDYLMRAEREKQQREMNLRNSDLLRKNGQTAQADKLVASLNGVDKVIADYKMKAVNLIQRSLKVMPANVVLDYGEPTPVRNKYNNGGVQTDGYSDGVLHDYVGLLFKAGDKKGAENLGATVASQLESIFNYFEKSDAYFAGSQKNAIDLFAALDAYLKIYLSANDPQVGNPSGELAKRTTAKLDYLYKVAFPSIYSGLEKKANDNGESTRRGARAGKYASMLFYLQDYLNTIGMHFGYLAQNQYQNTPPQDNSNGMSLEQMMQQMPTSDSMNQ